MATYPVTAIGATPVQVSAMATVLATGLLVVAAPANTKPVFVGNGATITPGTDTLSGIAVMPGGSVRIPAGFFCTSGTGTSLLSNAYCVAASGSNTVYVTPDGPEPGASGVAAGGAGGGPSTVADGADVAEGAVADAIVAAGAAGTLSAKLRRLTQGVEDLKTLIVLAGGAAIVGKFTTDQTTHGTTDLVAADTTKLGGIAIALNTGVRSTGTQRVTIATDDVVPITNTPLTNFGAGNYETVAASQTAQVMGGAGAVGDYLAGVLVIPASTSPGVVTILDNAISINVFAGGASSLSNLVPFFIPLGMVSVSGAWKLTTGANVSAIGVGKFT